MAEAIAGVRFDLTADSAQLEAKLAQANKSLRNAAAAGEAAGKQIGAAMTRIGGAIASAFAVDNIVRFAQESIRSAAAIGRFAAQAGMTAQEFQGLEFALRGAMVPTEQLAAGFAIFSRNLSDLERNTGPFLDFIRRFAPALEAQFRAARTTSEAFGVLTDAVNALGNEQDRVRLLNAAGAEQFGRLANAMRQGRGAIEEQTRSFQGLSDEAIRRAQDIERRWNEMWRNFTLGAQQAILGAIDAFRSADLSTMEGVGRELRRLQGIYDDLTARGRNTEPVLRRINELLAEQARIAAALAASALPSGPIKVDPAAAESMRLLSDRIKAAQGELALFQARLTTLPPQTEFISQSFAAAWERMRQVMILNNATESEIAAARLNLLRQEDAERMRILGGTLNAEEMLARRQAELHQARRQQLITEEQLNRALLAAEMARVSGMLGSFGQIAGSIAQIFNKQKGWAYAAAVINTAAAVTAAMAQPPYWPYNWPAVAAAAAAGAAQIAAISRTTLGGGGSVPSVGGGAGGAPAAPAATPQPMQAITVDLHGSRFSLEEVRALIERMNEFTRNGGTLIATAVH